MLYFGAQSGLEPFYEKNGCKRSLISYLIEKTAPPAHQTPEGPFSFRVLPAAGRFTALPSLRKAPPPVTDTACGIPGAPDRIPF